MVNSAGEKVPEQIFISLYGFFQFFAFVGKTGKRLELQSDVQTQGLSHCICIQVHGNKLTIHRNMSKYVVMASRGPTMNQTMNGISFSKINYTTSDIKIKKQQLDYNPIT